MSTTTTMPGLRRELRRPTTSKSTVSPVSTPRGNYEGAPDRLGGSWIWPAIMPITMSFMVGAVYVLHAMAH